ncbi:tail fiber protein [Pseudomonas sp. CGJS7]|uniref:tail fiber protein n=1 Tax=Pseudomonas sp. CGJS7 TaxID=3109348 RepID=UPI00300947F3
MAIDMMGDAPVGAIVPFFGEVPASVNEAGWLVCSGQVLSRKEWPDLFEAIGHAFGYKSQQDDFCLPDLRGVFLRTLDAGAGNDKNAKDRTPSGPNGSGNGGDKIGSFQRDATRTPRAGSFSIQGAFNADYNTTHDGCDGDSRIRYKSSSQTVDYGGGDAESRPVNINGIYLIKAKPNDRSRPAVGQVPVGAAMSLPFKPGPDTPVDDFWRYCEGQTFISAQGSTFYELFEMLQFGNGGESGATPRFAIPDLRGVFVRGLAAGRDGAQFDPDRGKRETPRPNLSKQGNAGDKVGSYQGWATAMPRKNAFSASIPSYPYDKTSKYQAGLATAAAFGSDKTFDVTGGDAETRPISMAMRWYIRFMASGTQPTPGEELPLGAVIAAGTEGGSLAKWRPCHGQILQIRDYEALFKIIGTQFGGDGKENFQLPDLRGYFLRGVGEEGASYPRPRGEPDKTAGAKQVDATAKPNNKFTVTLKNWPGGSTHNVINYGTGTRLLKVVGDPSVKSPDGDDETRPINVYVQHLIKVLY